MPWAVWQLASERINEGVRAGWKLIIVRPSQQSRHGSANVRRP